MADSERASLVKEAEVFADGMLHSVEAIKPENIDRYCSIVRDGIAHELKESSQDVSLAEKIPANVLLAMRNFIIRREYQSLLIEVQEEIED